MRTRAGYCGGTSPSPSYTAIGDHTEAVSIDFDPEVIHYEDLLKYFWNAHHCGSGGGMRQYMIAVFYHNEGQQIMAERQRVKQAAKQGVPLENVRTPVIPVGTFTYAEAYHQKYLLTRHSKLRTFLEQTYPDARELADSTVATRLNAFLGWGFDRDIRVLAREIGGYGLPADLASEVLAEARKR